MSTGRSRFVGIGVSSYTDEAYEALPEASRDVTELHSLLAQEFDGAALIDPDHNGVQTLLDDLTGSVPDGGTLVVQWSGHAVTAPPELGRLRLITTDSRTNARAGVSVAEVMAACAESGAAQIFVALDTCFSGAAVPTAAEVAARVWDVRPPDADRLWIGVLSASSAQASAYDGVLGARLRQLLQDGPVSAKHQLRWPRQNRLITGDDLGGALKGEWDLAGIQRPEFIGYGDPMPMFPNPRYDAGATPQVVEHLLVAARSAASLEELSAFTGRAAEVDTVVTWVHSGEPGLHVITGSAGTGKSAILGRVVSLSIPGERRNLLREGQQLEHDDPGPDSVAAHVHVRALTADGVAKEVDSWLIRASEDGDRVLTPLDDGRRNSAELAGALQRRAETHAEASPVVIVIDGLDEARGEAFDIVTDLLLRLARFATVIVSTREMHRPSDGISLLSLLAPAGPDLDLDDASMQERDRSALQAYVERRLHGVSAAMDGAAVGELVAQRWFDGGDRPFLLARLVADQLRAAPIDTSVVGWETGVSSSIEAAFDADIQRAAQDRGERESLVRHLLIALTWAYGSGFPEDEWIAVASSRTAPGDAAVTRDDVSWVLSELGRYILQDGESGAAVYRLAHASLGEHLRPFHSGTAEQPFDPAAIPVSEALLDRYARLLTAGVPADQPGYLWRYARNHARDIGPAGLDILRRLARVDSALRPDVAHAAQSMATTFRFWGYTTDAVPLTEESVAIYRDEASANPAYESDLAGALVDLGVRYGDIGRLRDAVLAAEEGVVMYRHLADANPAYRPQLGTALNNLGTYYQNQERGAEAIAMAEESYELFAALAESDPIHQPDLASALNNLGLCYGLVHRDQDAIGPAEEAVRIYRELASTDPNVLVDVALSLCNLATDYNQVGRHEEATAAAEESVAGYREQVLTNPAHRAGLAWALGALCDIYIGSDRLDDAISAIEEATTIFEDTADVAPVSELNLAVSLDILSGLYRRTGREVEAVALSREAIRRFREHARTDFNFRPHLGAALTELGRALHQAGHEAEAITAVEEAIILFIGETHARPDEIVKLTNALADLDAWSESSSTPDEADATWANTVAAVSSATASALLVARARDQSDRTSPRRISAWLQQALVLADQDATLVSRVHREARRQHQAAPADFDASWSEGSGSVPAWLTLDPAVIDSFDAWMSTPTYTEERDYLDQHPDLLDPAVEPELEEALLGRAAEDAERYRETLTAARESGVSTAYRPIMLRTLASGFINAGLAAQLTLLDQHADDLLSADLIALIDERMADEPDDDDVRAHALLTLIEHDAQQPVLDVLDGRAGESPEAFLQHLACSDQAGALLRPSSILIGTAGPNDDAAIALALFYLAVGTHLQTVSGATPAGLSDPAELIARARSLDPDAAPGWIARLAEIVPHHPEVATLFALLTQASTEPLPEEDLA